MRTAQIGPDFRLQLLTKSSAPQRFNQKPAPRPTSDLFRKLKCSFRAKVAGYRIGLENNR